MMKESIKTKVQIRHAGMTVFLDTMCVCTNHERQAGTTPVSRYRFVLAEASGRDNI
jgi:hypothetical protein